MLLRHRNDIDGLRAIAVLPVVLFHAGLGFPGGYVGVDVFFVISGYLITSIIAQEIADSRFSIVTFYERRIRRIFPALFAVIAVSSVLACMVFMPIDLILFGRSVRASALFYSNFLFLREAGYFDALEAVKPLLHTWSLAVEEQFYIVVPILLLLTRRSRGLQVGLLACLTLASLALSEWWVLSKPSLAFYMLPGRFWELGIGCLLSYVTWRGVDRPSALSLPSGPDQPSELSRPIIGASLTAAGLALIFFSVFTFDAATSFPGLMALVPCLGAALVIYGGFTPNRVSDILGSAPLAFIGLISYSLYLWHWPVLVFGQYQLGHSLTALQSGIAVLASLLIATFSWRFIEGPARRRNILAGRPSLLISGLVAIACAFGVGITIKHYHGFPGRLPDEAAVIYATKDDVSRFTTDDCFTDSKQGGPTDADVAAGRLCALGDLNATPASFLVWGDSHGGSMAPAIDRAASKHGQRGFFTGQGGCPPLLDYLTKQSRASNGEACVDRNAAVLDLIRQRHIALVFLVARWPREVLGSEFGNEGQLFDLADSDESEDRSAVVAAALDKTLSALASLHVRIVLVADVPEPGYDVPYAMARALRDHRPVDVDPTRAVVDRRRDLANRILHAAAAKYGTALVDPVPRFCDLTVCHVELGGHPLYVDADHMSATTAIGLSDLFDFSFVASDGKATLNDSENP